jgi:hypothetical protein
MDAVEEGFEDRIELLGHLRAFGALHVHKKGGSSSRGSSHT